MQRISGLVWLFVLSIRVPPASLAPAGLLPLQGSRQPLAVAWAEAA